MTLDVIWEPPVARSSALVGEAEPSFLQVEPWDVECHMVVKLHVCSDNLQELEE